MFLGSLCGLPKLEFGIRVCLVWFCILLLCVWLCVILCVGVLSALFPHVLFAGFPLALESCRAPQVRIIRDGVGAMPGPTLEVCLVCSGTILE